MQKKFLRPVSFIIAIAMVLTLIIVFCVQTQVSYQQAQMELDYLLDSISVDIAENDDEIVRLKESTGADYLARARAFSYMIEMEPELINSATRLNEIMKLLDVDELHVTDSAGVIRWGTVPGYFGFDMSESDQAQEFMPIIQDPSIEIAQDPQINGAEGVLFQYVSVARRDEPGIVQIGMQPTRLEAALQRNEIGNVMRAYLDEEEGVFALYTADNTVAWHEDSSLLGMSAEEIGLTDGVAILEGAYRNGTVMGRDVRLSARTVGEYVVVAYMYRDAMMANRLMQTIVLLISDILVVLVMVGAINFLLKRQIVLPIQKVASELRLIEGGQLDTTVKVRVSPEFGLLSDGINAMVNSIRQEMDHTQSLLQRQQATSVQMQQMAETLRELSDGNMSTAERLSSGAAEQADAIGRLTGSINQMVEQMQADSQRAVQAGTASAEAGESLRRGVEVLEQLSRVMGELNQMSTEIQKVVKSIDDISFQTNILALNAAVEAARAGQAGKGFAVVADEVRNLAGKSADSARQTAEMIGHTIEIMRSSQGLTARAVESIQQAMKESHQANGLTGDIVEASVRQSQTVEEIRGSSEQMGHVVQENARLAEASKEGVSQLLDEVQHLLHLSGGAQADKMEQSISE